MGTIELNVAISAAILAKLAEGLTMAQAIDAVLGAGTHAALASSVYDALRAR